uniref:glutathione S-transferase family protein n=1 Tax=unclassified Burkholderia TaxID=2613784 RepID=UPI00321856C8
SSIPRIGSSAQDHEHDISNAPPFEPVYTVPNFNSLLGLGPYFDGETFGMVDAVFAPIFRYFDTLETDGVASIFADVPKVNAWRRNLRGRASVIGAVSVDYQAHFLAHLRRQKAVLAEKM